MQRILLLGLRLFSVFLLFIAQLLPLTVAHAQTQDFSTSYNLLYEVNEDGTTLVTEKVTLKNLTSKFFASKYTLTIGSTTLTDIAASDQQGPLQTNVTQQDAKTQIEIKFNQQIAGEGKEQEFTLKYKSKDFAIKQGKTWEVDLPKAPNTTDIDSYDLVLSVPVSFGDPTSFSPVPKSQSSSYDKLFMTFSKDQLTQSGVSVNFGSTQIFDFTLTYNLENNSLFPILTNIALPSDNQYQSVVINRLDPQPLNVTIDQDGNYLAWYRLQRNTKQQVKVIGSSKLSINPAPLSEKPDLKEFLKPDRYWETDSPLIKAKLDEIFKNGTPNTTKAKAGLIYRYVVDNLKYDTSRLNDSIERLGATTALNNPGNAVCMEFTDLFITLARAAGIPARELDGYGYSQNHNLRPLSLNHNSLHAWPEYYDESRGWVMVDPTWENTSGGVDYFNKFDLNHFVLVTKGVSSTKPLTGDNVDVTISDADFTGKAQLETEVELPSTIWSGFPYQVKVTVTNMGNKLSDYVPLSINANKLTILGKQSVTLSKIPPFGNAVYTFNVRTPALWDQYQDQIEIDVAGQKTDKSLDIHALLPIQSYPLMIGILVGFFVLIYGGVLGYHLYRRRRGHKKKN